jgi:hypothetical protein
MNALNGIVPAWLGESRQAPTEPQVEEIESEIGKIAATRSREFRKLTDEERLAMTGNLLGQAIRDAHETVAKRVRQGVAENHRLLAEIEQAAEAWLTKVGIEADGHAVRIETAHANLQALMTLVTKEQSRTRQEVLPPQPKPVEAADDELVGHT